MSAVIRWNFPRSGRRGRDRHLLPLFDDVLFAIARLQLGFSVSVLYDFSD